MKGDDFLNIAYFVYNFDDYSGAAFQARKIADYLDDNHKIYIFSINNTRRSKRYDIDEKIRVINLYGNILKQAFHISKIVRDKNIKIFHLHGFITRALIIGKLLRQKIILKTTLMGTDDFDSIVRNSCGPKRIAKKYLLKEVDVNAALTKKMKGINSKYIDEDKIRVIPNGVLIPDFDSSMTDKENIFSIVGMICPRKRTYESIIYYIENYSHLKDAKLYLVGPTESNLPEFDRDYMEKCRRLVESNKDKNISITGKLDHDKLMGIYAKSKATILFSKKEGMPNVVLEAMAYNSVPIMTRMDGVAEEILDDDKYGFVLDSTDEKVDIGDIDELMEEKAPFKRVAEKYDIKNISSRYGEVYDDLKTR